MGNTLLQHSTSSLTEAIPIEQIKYMHYRLMKRFHPENEIGKVKIDILISIFALATAKFATKKLLPSFLEQVAFIWREITLRTPFLDGNKRMAYFIVLRWLQINGYTIAVKQPVIIQICMNVEDEDMPMEDLVEWLGEVVKPLKAKSH